jgi:hypothetical protein
LPTSQLGRHHGHVEDLSDDLHLQLNDHHTKAASAYTAVLTLYQLLWQIIKPRGFYDHEIINEHISPYWSSQISLGVSMGHFNLYDVHYQWHVDVDTDYKL